MMRKINSYLQLLNFLSLSLLPYYSLGQDTICISKTIEHKIVSQHLNEERNYWVSLPFNYSDSNSYPVIYVLDAEWRFDLVRNIVFDLGANNMIKRSIIVGIPHIDWDKKRGQDLTFSQSRIEYDGDRVDSTWYNDSNSGNGMAFYQYLTKELIPDVNSQYSTNNHETLVGHSYGGYFGAYLLSLTNPFEVMHLYDPSVWYSNGEVIKRLQEAELNQEVEIYLTYQPEPEFHKQKIEQLITELEKNKMVSITHKLYLDETHNSLFLDSIYNGIKKTHSQ